MFHRKLSAQMGKMRGWQCGVWEDKWWYKHLWPQEDKGDCGMYHHATADRAASNTCTLYDTITKVHNQPNTQILKSIHKQKENTLQVIVSSCNRRQGCQQHMYVYIDTITQVHTAQSTKYKNPNTNKYTTRGNYNTGDNGTYHHASATHATHANE